MTASVEVLGVEPVLEAVVPVEPPVAVELVLPEDWPRLKDPASTRSVGIVMPAVGTGDSSGAVTGVPLASVSVIEALVARPAPCAAVVSASPESASTRCTWR